MEKAVQSAVGEKIVVKLGNVLLGFGCAGLIRAYGRYKYYQGIKEATENNTVLNKSQSKTIYALIDKLKKQDGASE